MSDFDFATVDSVRNRNRINRASPTSLPLYLILALFVGLLGIHNFAARRYKSGVLQLVLSATVVGAFVSVPWVILDMLTTRTDGDGLRMK